MKCKFDFDFTVGSTEFGLIEAYWNVNLADVVVLLYSAIGLIEAYWNVN